MASHVIDFYNNKNVFITGGTGFVGVTVIEKLLRCCPNIKNIYLLIRPKKGKEISERLTELTNNSVFNRLREEKQTDLFEKLIAITGDVGDKNLGLSSEDRATLINSVHVIFHSAAMLDFAADVKSMININLKGTRRIVKLCQEIKDLRALVHVSSAYVNTNLQNVDEIVYPVPVDVNTILNLVDTLDSDALNTKISEMTKDHANLYSFTKHLAEYEVAISGLPATIVRPSMIIGAWQEPVPGWTISKNGPQGFMLGAGLGVVRRLPVAINLTYDYIPVDIVVNSLIVAAYNVDRDSDKELKVYHCTSSTCNPFQWAKVQKEINGYLHKYPRQNAVWYPHLKFLPSLFLFKISAIFIHFIPAYFFDMMMRLTGQRPRVVRLHTQINNSLTLLAKFIFQEWKFNNPHMLQLHESLSPDDQKLFTLDVRPLIWKNYFLHLIQGVRTYLGNESPKSLPKARSRNRVLLVLHLAVQAGLLGLIWWLIKVSFATTWTKTLLVVPITYLLFDQL